MFRRDETFQNLELDNTVFEEFINGLYYPYPYRFDVIPVKVIAGIYEEFLGKQLVIKNGKIEEITKSEYVKTNGAVCTPEHIVDMICKQTINLTDINTVEELLNIKVLDPSCGCGAFLVKAAEYMHERFSVSYSEIVSSYLYGVDIDNDEIDRVKSLLSLIILLNGEEEKCDFNFICSDTLDNKTFNLLKKYAKMDLIV